MLRIFGYSFLRASPNMTIIIFWGRSCPAIAAAQEQIQHGQKINALAESPAPLFDAVIPADYIAHTQNAP